MHRSQQTLAPPYPPPHCSPLLVPSVPPSLDRESGPWETRRAGHSGGAEEGATGTLSPPEPHWALSCPASNRAPVFILTHCLPLLLPPCWLVSSCRQLCAPDVAECFAVINEGCFLSEKKHHRRDESRHWGFPGQDWGREPWRLWRDHIGNFERVLLP